MFVMAHLVAWHVLGGGWRGAARAPFAVMVPAIALLVLNAVFYDSYQGLLLRLWALISWEFLYLLGYVTLRMMMRSSPVRS
jgi:chromate transport protein ChrA